MFSKKLPPLNSLVMFEAAARYCSFTIAAEELCVTQAAVSRQIRQLEEFLGNELFVRKHRKIELTAIGKEYAERTRECLIELSLVTEEARGKQNENQNTLRIIAGPCFSSLWLMPRLKRFKSIHPEITISLSVDDHADKRSDGEYDLAFFYSSQPDARPEWHRLFRERLFPVCSPDYLRKQGGKIPVEEIWDYQLLMMENWVDNWENWETWARREGLDYREPRDGLYLTEQTLIIEAAVQHCGIALAWDWHVQDLIKKGKLVCLYQSDRKRFGSFYLKASQMANPELTEHFFDWVDAELFM